eukprot:167758-Prorocentrum_minimum.AAC.3
MRNVHGHAAANSDPTCVPLSPARLLQILVFWLWEEISAASAALVEKNISAEELLQKHTETVLKHSTKVFNEDLPEMINPYMEMPNRVSRSFFRSNLCQLGAPSHFKTDKELY